MNLFYAACLLVAGAPNAESQEPTKPKPSSMANEILLSNRMCGTHFLVDAWIEGMGPYSLLLDTGAGVLALRPGILSADSSKEQSGTIRVVGADGRKSNQSIRTIHTTKIATQDFKNLLALEVDLSEISQTLGTPVDGILGFNAFQDRILVLDYPSKQARLGTSELPPPDDREILPCRFAGEAAALGMACPSIAVEIDGEDVWLILDSGSDETLALPKSFLSMKFLAPPTPVLGSITIHGSEEKNAARVGRWSGSFELGSHRISKPIMELGSGPARLGTGTLSNFSVTIDAKNSRVRFARSNLEAILLPSLRTPGVTFKRDSEFWTVQEIIPESTAKESNLQVGDRIVKIDGLPVSHWNCRDRNEPWIHDQVPLTLLRDGKEVSTVLHPLIWVR